MTSRKSALIGGALMVHLSPKLARGARINLRPILADVTNANFDTGEIAARVRRACAGKLAADAQIDDVEGLLEALQDVDAPDNEEMDGIDASPAASGALKNLRDWLSVRLTPADLREFERVWMDGEEPGAEREDDEDETETDDDEPAGPREFEGVPRTGASDSAPSGFFERFPDAARIGGGHPVPVRKKPSARVAMDAAVRREDELDNFLSRFPDAQRIG